MLKIPLTPNHVCSHCKQIHLRYSPPTKKLTFEDFKMEKPQTASHVAGTPPFSLLSPEGITQYRKELFRDDVLDACGFSPNAGTVTIRGSARYSKFIHDLWTHPETLRIMSDALEVPVEVMMPLEIGHANVQGMGDTVAEMRKQISIELPEASSVKVELTEAQKVYDPLGQSVVPWQ